MKRLYLMISLVLSAVTAMTAQPAPVPGLDAYIEKAMKDWETPGLSVVIVRNDSVIFAKGYGVRKMGENSPVTPNTIFACASTTKAFTAACLAMLVDEKKLAWDDPVRKYLPGFELFDPYVTREITVRDLLTHRVGIDRGDLLWYQSPYDRKEVLRRIRQLKPSASFRSRYGYQNIMYIAAGEVIEAISGKPWDQFIQERIFQPLRMTSSSTSMKALSQFTDVATHHVKIEWVMQPIPWPNYDNVGPAGSVNSSVADYANWIRMQLANGTFEGKRLLSEEVIKEMQTPQTVIRLDSLSGAWYPSRHFAAYGLGWEVNDFRGRKLAMHTGVLDGMRARVVLVPEEHLGMALMLNSENGYLHTAIAYRILDSFFGAPETDYSTMILQYARQQEDKAKADEAKKEASRKKGTKPSHELTAFEGTFEHEMYGTMNVQKEGAGLRVAFYPAYAGRAEHWHYNTFRVSWDDRNLGKDFVSFVLDSDGNVKALQYDGVGEFRKK